MHFRSILSGTLAVLMASAVAAPASGASGSAETRGGFSLHLPSFGLPGVFGGSGEDNGQAVQMAQSAGMTGLEDQVRQLNGKIEELNFQILQMQEQIRKQQEDNEFRFQQLEGGGQAPQKRS